MSSPEAQWFASQGSLGRGPMDPDTIIRYGLFLDTLRRACSPGGSELGLGLTLFSLAVSIRAATVIEIGRYKGFSGLALAGALRLLDDPQWKEPQGFGGRPGFDYVKHEGPRRRVLYSVDPNPDPEATHLWKCAGLDEYIVTIDKRSVDVNLETETPARPIDLIFIDGDHGLDPVLADVNMYVAALRPGGYFLLHDYYGWFDHNGLNGSPIKQACDNLTQSRFKEFLLVDTGYPSFMVFRKPS